MADQQPEALVALIEKAAETIEMAAMELKAGHTINGVDFDEEEVDAKAFYEADMQLVADLRAEVSRLQAGGGTVGEVLLFGGDPDLKVVSWVRGKMPPAGTKLYADHPIAAPAWIDGEPANILGVLADCDEWLALVERLHLLGRWKFSEADTLAKLRGCRAQVAKFSYQAAAPALVPLNEAVAEELARADVGDDIDWTDGGNLFATAVQRATASTA